MRLDVVAQRRTDACGVCNGPDLRAGCADIPKVTATATEMSWTAVDCGGGTFQVAQILLLNYDSQQVATTHRALMPLLKIAKSAWRATSIPPMATVCDADESVVHRSKCIIAGFINSTTICACMRQSVNSVSPEMVP